VTNQKQHNQAGRPAKSPSQICVSPRGKANQTHKRSQSPNTKKHKQKTDWTRKRRQPRGEGRGGKPGESGPTASTQATKANNKTATTTKLISDIAENKKKQPQTVKRKKRMETLQPIQSRGEGTSTKDKQQSTLFRSTPDGSRQVVVSSRKTIAFCKFTELMQS